MIEDPLPYVFRWERHGRKGEYCRVTARSRKGRGWHSPMIVSGALAPKNFNSVAVTFADGFTMVTSGYALRRRPV